MHDVLTSIRERKMLLLLAFVPLPLVGHSVMPSAINPVVRHLDPHHHSARRASQPCHGTACRAHWRHDRRASQRDARQPLRADHRVGGAEGWRIPSGEGVDCRRHRHQHAVHDRHVVLPRRIAASRPAVQQRQHACPVAMLFLAAFGLLFPSAIAATDTQVVPQSLSLVISILLIGAYGLGLVFTLGTHRKFFASGAAHGADGAEHAGHVWPVPLAVVILSGPPSWSPSSARSSSSR